jgi:hypothetical protein
MTTATHTVVGLFDEYSDAEGAIRELEAAGVPSTDISLIANNRADRYGNYPPYAADRAGYAEGSGTGTGAGIGAVLGGAAGLLAGIGALAIPGVGPVVAAGALASTLAGAGVGAVVGGLVGALVEAGIPREHADIYAEAVRRGGTLVTVRTDDLSRDRVSDILSRYYPVDVEERAATWRETGWTGFDERAKPYTDEFHRATPPVGSAAAAADRVPRTAPLPEPAAPASSSPIIGPTDTRPPMPPAEPFTPRDAADMQRDWEVRRDAERLNDRPEPRRGVRVYPPIEEKIDDKR